MRILFFLFSFIVGNTIIAQSSLWHQAAFLNKSIEDKPLSDSKRKEFQQFLQENFELLDTCVSPKRLMILNHKIASILYVLDAPKDSVEFFLNQAVAAAPQSACRVMSNFEKARGNKNTQNKFLQREYFAREFSEEWWQAFEEQCKQYSADNNIPASTQKRKMEIIDHPTYADSLASIQLKDQAFRAELSKDSDNELLWKKQRKYDLANRIQLDALHEAFGFPSPAKVGEKGFLTAWYVLQHSTDCTWNKKWIVLFIETYKRDKIFQGLIPQTINRFLHPTRGYCETTFREDFIAQLATDYSKEIAQKFGYLEFIKN